MRILEARFHPQCKDGPSFVVVGHLVWKRSWLFESPVFEAHAPVPDPVISKLRYLVDVSRPDCFSRLQSLRSRFWSFVEVPPLRARQRWALSRP